MIRRYEYDRLNSSRSTGKSRALRFFRILALSSVLVVAVPSAFSLPISAPRAVSLNMRTVTHNDLKWVRSTTEIYAVLPIPLEAYRTVLMDVSSYPRFVPHLAAVDIFTSPAGIPAVRQRLEVKILGFTFVSIFAVTLEPDDSCLPSRWRLAWNYVDSDGTVSQVSGYWELEDVSEDGESRVLVRHINDGLVKKKYPFQAGVMRMVGERELAAALLTAYHEALRRWPELNRVAKKDSSVENLPGYRADDKSPD